MVFFYFLKKSVKKLIRFTDYLLFCLQCFKTFSFQQTVLLNAGVGGWELKSDMASPTGSGGREGVSGSINFQKISD